MSHFLSPVFAPGFFGSEAVHIALGVGAIVAIVTGVVGVFTVMRGQSFAGEAFGDIGTTGGSGAFLVGVGPLWGFVVGNLLAAAAMETIGIQRPRGRDLATGIVLGASIGLAALFLYLDDHRTEHHGRDGDDPVRLGVRDRELDGPADPAPQPARRSRSIIALYRPLLLSHGEPRDGGRARNPRPARRGAVSDRARACDRARGDHDRLDTRDRTARRPGRERPAPDQAPAGGDADRGRDRDRGDVGRDRCSPTTATTGRPPGTAGR